MFLSTFLIVDLYSVTSVGDFALFSSIISICVIFSSFRLEQAVSKSNSGSKVNVVTNIITFISLVYSVIFITLISVLYIFGHDYLLYITLIFLGSLALLLVNYVTSLSTYEQNFLVLSVSKVIKSIAFIVLICIFSGFSNGLLYSYLISSLILCVYAISNLSTRIKIDKFTISKSLNNRFEYRYIYKYSTLNALLNSTSHQIPILMSSLLFPIEIVGLIFIYEKIVKTPSTVIMQSIRPIVIRYYSTKSNLNFFVYFRHCLYLATLGLLYISFMYLLVSFSLSFDFTIKWQDGFVFLVPLLIITFCQIVNTVTSPYLLVKRKTKNLFNIEIINLILKIVISLYCYLNNHEPITFFILLSISSLVLLLINIANVKLSS